MNLKYWMQFSLLAVFLSGCVSSAGYQRHLDNWEGKDLDQLVSTWGYPATSYRTARGNLVYEYRELALSSSRQNATGSHIDHCTTRVISNRSRRIIGLEGSGNDCGTCDYLLCHINPFSLLYVLGDPQGDFPHSSRTETYRTSFREGSRY